MASAIHQLIAQHAGPDIVGSYIGGAGAAQRQIAAQEDSKLRQLQTTEATKKLAMMDQAAVDANKEKGMKIIADANRVLGKLDPSQRAAAYAQIKSQAESNWPGLTPWPTEYNDAVQNHMDMVTQHIYGAEQFKTDEEIRKEQAKFTGAQSTVGKLIADRDKLPEGDPRRALYDAAIEKAGKSNGQQITLNINDGKQELTKSNITDVQKQLLDAEKGLTDLESIANQYKKDYLTLGGRVESTAGALMDLAGFDRPEVKFNADKTKFENSVRQYFNQYKKEITGAAASEKEMEDLMSSMFNTKQGPIAFSASFSQFFDKAKKNYELNKAAAREGVDVSKGKNFKMPEPGKIKPVNEKGWMLHTDAQGNRAYVSPDGDDYEEVDD